jgi:hypothetical protein
LAHRGNVNRDKVGNREPVRKAHVDYTVNSGPNRVRDVVGAEADKLLKGRFAEVNVWQPLRVSCHSENESNARRIFEFCSLEWKSFSESAFWYVADPQLESMSTLIEVYR